MQHCVSKYNTKVLQIKTEFCPPQIGNRFALTAAHCLYSDDNEEVLPATSFSIMLGLHDRRKAKEPHRWLFRFTKGSIFALVCICFYRTHVYMGSNHWVLMSKTHRPFVETPCWSLIEYLVEEVVQDLVEDLVDFTD